MTSAREFSLKCNEDTFGSEMQEFYIDSAVSALVSLPFVLHVSSNVIIYDR